jgi:thiol-disulfide isomerase/thioredoxin
MKHILILIVLVALGYFAYNSFNNSETINQESARSQIENQEGLEDLAAEIPEGQQGALVDINNQIQDALSSARDAVEKTQNRVNNVIEEGITDLGDTDVDVATDTQASAGPGLYTKYQDVTIASLDGDIVLDFYASWCPSCRRLESDINDSLNDIPSDLNIVVVDYDTETALKAKYGVTRQHTLVQVDNQGNTIKKWSGGNTLESMMAEII